MQNSHSLLLSSLYQKKDTNMIRTNIRGRKYSNIFEYPNIRHTMPYIGLHLLNVTSACLTSILSSRIPLKSKQKTMKQKWKSLLRADERRNWLSVDENFYKQFIFHFLLMYGFVPFLIFTFFWLFSLIFFFFFNFAAFG